MIKTTLITLTTLGLLSVTASAYDTSSCGACHGKNFEKTAMGKSKIVKDLTAEEITKALKGYKDGTYGGAMKMIMKGQAAKLTDDDIKAIAEAVGKKADDAKADDAKTEDKKEDNATEAKKEDNTTK